MSWTSRRNCALFIVEVGGEFSKGVWILEIYSDRFCQCQDGVEAISECCEPSWEGGYGGMEKLSMGEVGSLNMNNENVNFDPPYSRVDYI